MTLEVALLRHPGAQTLTFGDGPRLIATLTALVRSGVKRATCSAPVIETKELVRTTWKDMTEAKAFAKGEDDTLQGGRTGHRRYFTRQAIFAPDMGLIWDRFDVVGGFGVRCAPFTSWPNRCSIAKLWQYKASDKENTG